MYSFVITQLYPVYGRCQSKCGNIKLLTENYIYLLTQFVHCVPFGASNTINDHVITKRVVAQNSQNFGNFKIRRPTDFLKFHFMYHEVAPDWISNISLTFLNSPKNLLMMLAHHHFNEEYFSMEFSYSVGLSSAAEDCPPNVTQFPNTHIPRRLHARHVATPAVPACLARLFPTKSHQTSSHPAYRQRPTLCRLGDFF